MLKLMSSLCMLSCSLLMTSSFAAQPVTLRGVVNDKILKAKVFTSSKQKGSLSPDQLINYKFNDGEPGSVMFRSKKKEGDLFVNVPVYWEKR